MVYCETCDIELKDEVERCPLCGGQLARVEAAPGARSATLSPSEGISKEPLHSSAMATVHPWRRFFARTIDLLTGGVVCVIAAMFGIAFVLPNSLEPFLAAVEHPIYAGVWLYLLWLPVEAAFLARTGSTPGKWVFGIKVVKAGDDRRLDFGEALSRTANVWFRGEGLGIPLVAFITRIVAYRTLMREDRTSWDAAVGSEVVHAPWGLLRAMGATLAVIATLMWLTLLNAWGAQ